ncbi:MAG: SRPBCC domain-containing protein [Acidimicrobiales bacterium]
MSPDGLTTRAAMNPLFITTVHWAEVPAPPERVWAAITSTSEPSPAYFGLWVTSSWKVDHGVTLTSPIAAASTQGVVLTADRPVRLVHSLGLGDDATRHGVECTTWVTWELHPVAGGTLVTLSIDDLLPDGDGADDTGPAMLQGLVSRFSGELTRP